MGSSNEVAAPHRSKLTPFVKPVDPSRLEIKLWPCETNAPERQSTVFVSTMHIVLRRNTCCPYKFAILPPEPLAGPPPGRFLAKVQEIAVIVPLFQTPPPLPPEPSPPGSNPVPPEAPGPSKLSTNVD